MIAKRDDIGVEVKGAWYYYPNKDEVETDAQGNLMKWQGAASFRQYLDENEDFLNILVDNVKNKGQITAKSLAEEEVEQIEEEDKEIAQQMAEIESEQTDGEDVNEAKSKSKKK